MNVFKILAFYQSRKVAFGLWLFIVSNIYLWFKVLTSQDWMTCIALCSALIGGGTVADRFLEAKKAETPKS